MLQIHTFSSSNTYRPNDLQGTIMPAADKAESSGYLDPGVLTRILE